MESRRRTEKNRIRIKIRETTKYMETDTNTINRLKYSQINIDFNKRQILKLTEKNKEREELIDELNKRNEDLDLGELDNKLEEEYLETQREVNKKDNESIKKKQYLKDMKNVDKEKSNVYWKSNAADARAIKFYQKDIDRGEKFFFKLCNTIPEYMLKKLSKMPNNKGYIWRGVSCFGDLPRDKENKTVLFERHMGVLRIHEFYPDMIEIWEKPERSGRILISRTHLKMKQPIQ